MNATDDRSVRWTGCALILVLLVTANSRGQIQIPADAPLFRDELQRRFDWINDEDMRAFDQHGSVPAEWRDKVREFITEGNRHQQQQPTSTSGEEFYAQGRTLAEAGIRDPQFLYHLGCVEAWFGENQSSLGHLSAAAKSFSEQGYPARLRFFATGMANHAATQIPFAEEQALWQSETAQNLPAFLAEWSDDARQRFVLSTMIGTYDALSGTQARQDWIDRLARETQINAWTMGHLRGCLHRDLAWQARGEDVASTVTDEGWRIFGEEMTTAAKHFHAAWEQHPEFPEPATELISIAMAAGGDDEQARLWFDRAIKGEADHKNAYGMYRRSLLPKWGGSYQSLMAFGNECAKTERFDTDIPYQFVASFYNIIEEQDRASIQRLVANERLYQRLTEILRKSAEDPARSQSAWGIIPPATLRLIHLALALHGQRIDESMELLKQIDRVDYKFLDRWKVDHAQLAGVAYAEAGRPEAKAKELMGGSVNLYGDIDTIQEWLDDLRALKQELNDPHIDALFNTTVNGMEFELHYQKGEWVHLRFCNDGSNWQRMHGSWQYNSDREVEGFDSGHTQGLRLFSRNIFPPPIELKVTLSTDDPTEEGVWTGIRYGAAQAVTRLASRMFVINPVTHRAAVTENGAIESDKAIPSAEEYELRIEVWDHHYRMYVNDQLVLDQHDATFEPPSAFELISLPTKHSVDVKFKNFQVRKLTAPRPEADREEP